MNDYNDPEGLEAPGGWADTIAPTYPCACPDEQTGMCPCPKCQAEYEAWEASIVHTEPEAPCQTKSPR